MFNKNRSFEMFKNKIIDKLKTNLSNKMNYINNVIEKDIEKESIKEKPRGFLKSAIANYKNNDVNLSYTIINLLLLTIPGLFFFSTMAMATTFSNLIGTIFMSVLSISATTLLSFIIFEESDRITISEKKMSEINLIKENLNKKIEEKNNKIDNIFDNTSKKRFEEDFTVKYKGLAVEQISLFNDNIDMEIFNLLKSNFSKKELMSLLSNLKGKEITYDLLIEFIDNIERIDKSETLYNAMFEVNSNSIIKEKEESFA